VALAVANAVTLSRVLTVPMGIWGFWPNFVHGHQTAALLWLAAAVLLAAVSDAYDGILARELNATSESGAMFDPAMDKAFAGTFLILLLMTMHRSLGHWDSWIVARLSIDVTLAILAAVGPRLLADREVSAKALWSGKIKFHFDVAAVLVGFVLFITASSPAELHQAGVNTDRLVAAACAFGALSLGQHIYSAVTAKRKAV
jgi:CDP-diacylglycerol---glycerol-3-phosphate 3-phosphatidyltransferase